MGGKVVYGDQTTEVINKVKELASLPNVAVSVIQKTLEPGCSFNEIAEIVETDQALTMKVLRVANSPFYGRPSKISTIKNAIIVLGLNTLKSIVLTISVMDSLKRKKGGTSGLDRDKFWAHSLACAIACRQLCENFELADPDEAFMAGILHDVGVLIFDQYMQKPYEEAILTAHKECLALNEVEEDLFGLNHAALGRQVMEKWQFPEGLARAVEHHHDDFTRSVDQEGPMRMAAVVQLGNILCYQVGYQYINQPNRSEDNLVSRLGMLPGDINKIKRSLPDKIREMASNLNISTQGMGQSVEETEGELLEQVERANQELGRMSLELNKALAELTLLHQISQEISTSTSHVMMMERAGRQLLMAFECSMLVFYLPQGQRSELYIYAAGPLERSLTAFVVETCLSNLRDRGIPQPKEPPQIVRLCKNSEKGPLIAYPASNLPDVACETMVSGSKLIGLLIALDTHTLEFGFDSTRIMKTVSSYLAMGIQKSRLDQITKFLSVTDELTRLSNYREIQKRLEEEFARCRRYKHELSVLLVDIDHFKRINDTHGHLEGDNVLRELGVRLKGTLREVDIAGRHGGEEFLVILPETGLDGARVTAERIRQAMASSPFGQKSEIPVQVSIGVASVRESKAVEAKELLNKADQALYLAKQNGRNQVCAWEPKLAKAGK